MGAIEKINSRTLIEGSADKLMCIYPLKHKWARDIWKVMLANTWFPQEVDLSRDVKDYKGNMNDAEKQMYERALAFLSNLDGIQFNNLMFNIGQHITSPEVVMCISRQSFEEAVHVDSYATLIEAISIDPINVYMTYERDPVLANKNAYIMRQSEILKDEYNPRNFALALIANIVLEGIYFYSGFLAFYTLARNGKMLGSANMIKFIQRDEEVHMRLFVYMLKTLQSEMPSLFDQSFWHDAEELIKAAVELESMWGKHIIAAGVLGLTDKIIDEYVRHLANSRCADIGMPPIYQNVKNPVPWVEQFSKPNNVEANFFECKVSDYQVGGALNWD